MNGFRVAQVTVIPLGCFLVIYGFKPSHCIRDVLGWSDDECHACGE